MYTDKSIKIFVVFVSAFLILYGILRVSSILLFFSSSNTTKGTIIGSTVVEEFHDGLKTYYYPKVSFIHKDTGEEIIGESIYSTKSGNADVGKIVSIYYKKDNPSKIIIESFREVWYTPVTSILGGVFIFLIYYITHLPKRSSRKKH
ncbi:DUF3592 domain-containing protein [Clostridium thermarum]|uniref:DUF3592 domain-containing protein n=1 Tax=Clostridium thermarum TaxID=1716543 RepID=UPI0013D49965|nr:DUF3592 domain-containing protein [Clostridium thermarum]